MLQLASHIHRILAPLSLVIAAVAGLTLGACQDDDQDLAAQVQSTCEQYCERAAKCDEDTSVADCTNTCDFLVTGCEIAERNEALDQVEECSDTSCDELLKCKINAGAQCVFGLLI